jgi:hypothetical protein
MSMLLAGIVTHWSLARATYRITRAAELPILIRGKIIAAAAAISRLVFLIMPQALDLTAHGKESTAAIPIQCTWNIQDAGSATARSRPHAARNSP